jgi:catechol 2,3-dioxygenase-like lactoylglutathione lyase family enzyme
VNRSIDVIMLSVADLQCARRFSERGLGCVVADERADRSGHTPSRRSAGPTRSSSMGVRRADLAGAGSCRHAADNGGPAFGDVDTERADRQRSGAAARARRGDQTARRGDAGAVAYGVPSTAQRAARRRRARAWRALHLEGNCVRVVLAGELGDERAVGGVVPDEQAAGGVEREVADARPGCVLRSGRGSRWSGRRPWRCSRCT